MAPIKTVSVTWDDEDRPVITVTYGDGAATETQPDPSEWLTALAERLPDKSARYLRKLMEVNETNGEISLAELATHLQVDKKDVDGWNRNLGRSIKAVVRDLGFLRPEQEDGTAQLFDFVWKNDANMWLYGVPERFRATLTEALDAR
jgi:hypothetical protein